MDYFDFMSSYKLSSNIIEFEFAHLSHKYLYEMYCLLFVFTIVDSSLGVCISGMHVSILVV